jgi:DNA-binding LacI/PurR family transcriptional regulator
LEQSIEALVVIASHRRILSALETLQRELPVVTLQTGGSAIGLNVSIDQRRGVREAVRQSRAAWSRTHPAHCGAPDFLEAEIRRGAFKREVRGAGAEPLPVLVGDWSPDSGYRLAKRREPCVMAVVCGNDQMALGTLHALQDAGRRVPEDVSVVGFDDTRGGSDRIKEAPMPDRIDRDNLAASPSAIMGGRAVLGIELGPLGSSVSDRSGPRPDRRRKL